MREWKGREAGGGFFVFCVTSVVDLLAGFSRREQWWCRRLNLSSSKRDGHLAAQQSQVPTVLPCTVVVPQTQFIVRMVDFHLCRQDWYTQCKLCKFLEIPQAQFFDNLGGMPVVQTGAYGLKTVEKTLMFPQLQFIEKVFAVPVVVQRQIPMAPLMFQKTVDFHRYSALTRWWTSWFTSYSEQCCLRLSLSIDWWTSLFHNLYPQKRAENRGKILQFQLGQWYF